MARASSSLPEPEGPVISTLTSEEATMRACSSTRSISGLRVMMLARQASVSWLLPAGVWANASSMALNSSSRSTGLVRKLNTPCWVAFTASGMEPWAVRMITGRPGTSRWIAWNSAMPSISSMRRSESTMSGRSASSLRSASGPLSAVVTR